MERFNRCWKSQILPSRDEFHGLGSATVSVAAVGVSPTASFQNHNSYRGIPVRREREASV
ncbi:MAG: hypothetical protein ACLQVY_17530 [Limisphaerales bacterium]